MGVSPQGSQAPHGQPFPRHPQWSPLPLSVGSGDVCDPLPFLLHLDVGRVSPACEREGEPRSARAPGGRLGRSELLGLRAQACVQAGGVAWGQL